MGSAAHVSQMSAVQLLTGVCAALWPGARLGLQSAVTCHDHSEAGGDKVASYQRLHSDGVPLWPWGGVKTCADKRVTSRQSTCLHMTALYATMG